MSASEEDVFLEIFLDNIARYSSGVFKIPKIVTGSSAKSLEILKKILSAGAKKNIQLSLRNLRDNQELSEAINSEEFQEFFSKLIKENSERSNWMKVLLEDLVTHLKLSRDREVAFLYVLFQNYLETIPGQSGWTIVPALRIDPTRGGMDILRRILSEAAKNKNIQGIRLWNIRDYSDNKVLSEAVNSEEFQKFLSGLITGASIRSHFVLNLFSELGDLGLSQQNLDNLKAAYQEIQNNALLQACLEKVPSDRWSLVIPRLEGVTLTKSNLEILKEILSEAIKNKNIYYINLEDLSDNKGFAAAVNLEEFQEFFSSLIKGSDNLHVINRLLSDLYDRFELSKENYARLQAQAFLEIIPIHSSGHFEIPKIEIEQGKGGVEILKKILSAVAKNKNIESISISNRSDKKRFAEAVNSEEFQDFLSSLIQEKSGSPVWANQFLNNLVENFNLSKEREEVLRNELIIAAMVPCEPDGGFSGFGFHPDRIMLNAFFKHPLQLTAFTDKIAHLDTSPQYRYYHLGINISQLGSITPRIIADFFKGTRFPKGFESLFIVSDNVLEDYKTIIELLEIMKQANLKSLRLQGAFGTLPFKQFEMLLQSILKTPWVKELDLQATQLEHLKDEDLLTLAGWLRQSKKLDALILTYNKFESRPIPLLVRFAAEIVQGPTNIALWTQDNLPKISEAWNETERCALIDLHLLLIPKDAINSVRMYSYLENSPISGLVSKQEECDLLCQLIKHHPDNVYLLNQIIRWINNFSGAQRFALAECHLKLNGFIGDLKELNLSSEQRLELFLRYSSKFLADVLFGFGKFTEDYFDNTRLAIFDCEFPGRPFIDAWKEVDNNLPSSEEDLEEYDLDRVKTEVIGKLLPALEKANQTVWKISPFYNACFEYIKKQLAGRLDSDPIAVFRFVQLLQWYTWFMSRLAKAKAVEPAILSSVLKELAGYPDRRVRCKLSEALLLLLETQQGQELYGKLIKKKKGSSLLLPEILLAGIVLDIFSERPAEEKERKESMEQAELLKIAQEISTLLSNKYDNGHYMRALISSVHVLSLTKTLTQKQKLLLIKNLLQPSEQFLKTEQTLVRYFNSLKGQLVQAQTVKEKLAELLSDHSQLSKILAGFSKYFPKDTPKQLTKKEINPLSRGVLEKFRQLAHEKAFREQLSNWYLIEGLTLLDEIAILTEKTPEQYNRTLYETFQKIFQLDNEQMRFYKDTFAGQRNETALLTYLGKIRSLKQGEQEERESLERTFRSIVRNLLTEDQSLFYQKRYDTRQSEHLNVIFSHYPELGRLWPQNLSIDFNVFLAENGIIFKPFEPDYVKLLITKIYHNNHLYSAGYPFLRRYLDNLDDKKIREEVKETLEVELKRFQEMSAEERSKDPKIELRVQLQLVLIQLVESSKVAKTETRDTQGSGEISSQKQCIGKALGYLRKLNEGFEFSHDLRALLKNLSNSKHPLDLQQSKDWRIVFTDHYWDLFMSGTDVEGSCQRVDGDPTLNRCLSAYVGDGKIKMITISDSTGKIIARCITRILWDEKDRTPVLYLEESYPHFLRSEQILAIEKFAIHLAEDLNIPLVSADSTESSVKYPNQLVSLSGIGPEYVDAIYRVTENGVFSIPHSQILFKPSLEKALEPKSFAHFTWQKKLMLPEGSEVKKLREIAEGGVEKKQLVEKDTAALSFGVKRIVGEKWRGLETMDRKEWSEAAQVFESTGRLQSTRSQDLAGQFQFVSSEFDQSFSTRLSLGVSEKEALLRFSDSSLKSQLGCFSRRELTESEWDTVLSMAWEPSCSAGKVQTVKKMTSKEADTLKEKLATAGVDVNVMATVGSYLTKEYRVEIPQATQLALTEFHKESVMRR